MRTEIGLGVLHLFCRAGEAVDREAAGAAIKAVEAADGQVVTAAMLGHKCDLAVMALHRDWLVSRRLQTGLQTAGLDVVDSYVSVTEVSEYAKGMPEGLAARAAVPVAAAGGEAGVLLLPDDQASRGARQLVRDAVRTAERADARTWHDRAHVRRQGRPADHRLHRAR